MNRIHPHMAQQEAKAKYDSKRNLLAFLEAQHGSIMNMQPHEKQVFLSTQKDLHNLRIDLIRQAEGLPKKSKQELQVLLDKTYEYYSYLKRTSNNLFNSENYDSKNMSGLLSNLEKQEDRLEAIRMELESR
jgi:hypothetical protein